MTLSRNLSDLANNVDSSGTLGVSGGGTGQTTASSAFAALAPSQSGNDGKFLTTNGSTISWGSASSFTSGTLMIFQQTAAPTGWTKQTTHDNKALRIVSGSVSSGGTVAFTTAFASGLTAGSTTLSTAQMPSHTHTVASGAFGGGQGQYVGGLGYAQSQTSSSTGGGESHNHTLPSFDVAYVDVIIASKD